MTKVENKKYELLETHSVDDGFNKLFRIRALRSFGDVNEGQLGGYVESELNLSHEGDSWVYYWAKVKDNAKVIDNAKVRNSARVIHDAVISGNAVVYDEASVEFNAVVKDNAQVYGNARLTGNSEISGNAKVYGNADICDNACVFDNAEVNYRARIHWKARIYGNARVTGFSLVSGNAEVYGDALVVDQANVDDKSKVFGNSIIGSQARLKGNVQVYDNAKVLGKVELNGNAIVDDIAFLSGDFVIDGESHISNGSDFEVFYVNWGSHSKVPKTVVWTKSENKWNVVRLDSDPFHLTDEEFIKFGKDIDEKTGLIFEKYVEIKNFKTTDVKYIILKDDEHFVYPGTYRIKAIKSFGDVEEGDIGGYVRSEKNLSHSGFSWVYDNAVVKDDAIVKDDAKIMGTSVISDNAKVYGNAVVNGNSKIDNFSQVFENATVENARITNSSRAYGSSTVTGSTMFNSSRVYGNAGVSESGLSGNCEIYDNAAVYRSSINNLAKVYGDAELIGPRIVVGDQVKIFGGCRLASDTSIYGDFEITSSSDIVNFANPYSHSKYTWIKSANKICRDDQGLYTFGHVSNPNETLDDIREIERSRVDKLEDADKAVEAFDTFVEMTNKLAEIK